MHRFNPEHHARLDDAQRFEWQDPVKLIDWLRLDGDETVVDVGAGTGFMALPLAEQLPRGFVVGVDISSKMRDILTGKVAERGMSNVTGLVTDGLTIDLPDAAADVVLLANVWHELSDSDALIKEFRRLVKPGGRLVVVDWKAEETPVGPPIAERIPEAAAIAALAAVGFKVVVQPELYPYHYTAVFT